MKLLKFPLPPNCSIATAAAIALALDPPHPLTKRVFQDHGTSGFVLLDENRMFINFWKTDHFPGEIPPNIRGRIGRSRYVMTIYPVPPKLSVVVIKYHGVGSYQCDLLKEGR